MTDLPDTAFLDAAETRLARATAETLVHPYPFAGSLTAAADALARIDAQFALYRRIRTVDRPGRSLAAFLAPVIFLVALFLPVMRFLDPAGVPPRRKLQPVSTATLDRADPPFAIADVDALTVAR